jgi:hypothetical protein
MIKVGVEEIKQVVQLGEELLDNYPLLLEIKPTSKLLGVLVGVAACQ